MKKFDVTYFVGNKLCYELMSANNQYEVYNKVIDAIAPDQRYLLQDIRIRETFEDRLVDYPAPCYN